MKDRSRIIFQYIQCARFCPRNGGRRRGENAKARTKENGGKRADAVRLRGLKPGSQSLMFFWIFAAVTVFCRRHAIVIGPTPPGTGVMAPATSAHSA